MSEASKSRRRWFRFSLRTMFILIAVAGIPLGWLVWNVQEVRERERLLEVIDLRGGMYRGIEPKAPQKPLPIIWRCLNAQRFDLIELRYGTFTDREVEHIKSLFLEANVVVDRQGFGLRIPVSDTEPTSEKHRTGETGMARAEIEAAAIAEIMKQSSLRADQLEATAERDGADWRVLVNYLPAIPGAHWFVLMSNTGEVKEIIGGA